MFDKNKLCISKKFFYLFLITLFIIGIFLLISYLKNNQLSSSSKAAPVIPSASKNNSSPIIGGTSAKVGEFPFMSIILTKNQSGDFFFVCGGVLINSSWILTAAHCFDKIKSDNLYVFVNEILIGAIISDEQENKVLKVIKHNGYLPLIGNNDIALLKLQSEILDIKPPLLKLNENLYRQFDILKDRTRVYKSQRYVIAIGYGTMGISPTPSVTPYYNYKNGEKNFIEVKPLLLQKIYLPIKSSDSFLPKNFFKFGYADQLSLSKTVSFGDSGGPILIKSLDTYYLIGLISTSPAGVVEGKSKGLKLINYLDWIDQTIENN